MKWKPFKKKNYFKVILNRKYRFDKRCFRKKYFLFKIRIEEELRWSWLNSKGKFYSNRSLRSFNMIRKHRKSSLTSIQEWRKQHELIRYSDEV